MKTNDTQETNVKPKNRLLRTFKKHKILFFLFLFFALGTNVFAWFVFNSIVSMNITGHVRAWDISIGEDGQTWDVNLKDLYPGMTTITEETKLSNNGESAANVELNVFKCRYILGLSNRETAERLGYTIDRIKQINREISKKM